MFESVKSENPYSSVKFEGYNFNKKDFDSISQVQKTEKWQVELDIWIKYSHDSVMDTTER